MKRYVFTLQTALILSALAARGQGTMIYDQQSAANRDLGVGGATIQQIQPMGQSFTPALSSVGFVQFEFTDPNPGNGLGATVYVNLLADSITGTVLDSTAPVSMPDGVFAAVTSFFFATPVAVTPGTTYYLQPVVQSGDQWDVVVGNYGYPGGVFYGLGAPDPDGYDLWFREGYVVPEPPSGLLVLLGVAGILAARRVRRIRGRHLAAVLIGLLASAAAASAQPQIGERVLSPPRGASYFSWQRWWYPPLPFLPFDVPVYQIVGRTNGYVYDDRTINYDELEQAQRAAQAQLSLGAGGMEGDNPAPLDYGTNLWLEITDIVTNAVDITAHNVDDYKNFQLLSKTDLVAQLDWTFEQQFVGLGGTNLPLAPVPENGRPSVFFWAAQSDTMVWVTWGGDAIRPTPTNYSGQPGYFLIQRASSGSYPELPIYYRISGTASNGVDYTYLSGTTNIPALLGYIQLWVNPLPSFAGSNLTVTLTLIMTNGYLVDSNSPSATVVINANVFSQVAAVYRSGRTSLPPADSIAAGVGDTISLFPN